MSDPEIRKGVSSADSQDTAVSEVLGEMTDRPASEFQSDEEYDFPHPDNLESVPEDER